MTRTPRSHHFGAACGRCLVVSRCRTIRFSSGTGDNWKGARHRERQPECRSHSMGPRNLPKPPRGTDVMTTRRRPAKRVMARLHGAAPPAGMVAGGRREDPAGSLHGGDWEDGRANWRGSGQPPVPNPPILPNPPTTGPDFPATSTRRKSLWCKMWHPTCTMNCEPRVVIQ